MFQAIADSSKVPSGSWQQLQLAATSSCTRQQIVVVVYFYGGQDSVDTQEMAYGHTGLVPQVF